LLINACSAKDLSALPKQPVDDARAQRGLAAVYLARCRGACPRPAVASNGEKLGAGKVKRTIRPSVECYGFPPRLAVALCW
jgi:hypothetical protein